MHTYISNRIWQSLPLIDYRCRFFVECFREKLSIHTPHFAQARLLNVFGSYEELRSSLEKMAGEEREKSYVLSALDEIEDCLSRDDIAASVLREFEQSRLHLFKKFRKGDVGKSIQNNMLLLTAQSLALRDAYSSELDSQLHQAVNGVVDLTKKERVLIQIDDLTGKLITDLLTRGYSPTHLFNRADLLTRANKYKGRNFADQFQFVIGKIRNEINDYQVCFAISSASLNSIRQQIEQQGFIFGTELDPKFATLKEKLEKDFTATAFVSANAQATDHVTAAWKVKAGIERALDLSLALTKNAACHVSANAAVGHTNTQIFHCRTVNVNVLENFLTSEAAAYFGSSHPDFVRLLTSLSDKDAAQLSRCFRYIRLSKESRFTEQKLLNLWIALEAIYFFGNQGILDNILKYAPIVYSAFSSARRLTYLKSLLIANSVQLTPLCRTIHTTESGLFDSSYSEDLVLRVISDRATAVELFDSLGDFEHLKYSLLKTREGFESAKIVNKRINRSSADACRQVRRIYKLRNEIAHMGFTEGIRPQLVTHLFDYVTTTLHALLIAAQVPRDKPADIDQLLDSFVHSTVLRSETLEGKGDGPVQYSDIALSPIL